MISTVLPQARLRVNQKARQPAPHDGNQSFVSRGKQLVFQPRALKSLLHPQNEGATIRGTFHGSYLLKKTIVRKSFPRLTLHSPPALAVAWPQPCPRNDVIQNQLLVRKIVGSVISPILANVYLHYVLDEWIARDVLPRLKGRAFVVRYADDFVIGFTREDDARRVWDVLPKRFDKYGLTVHPEKTRLIPFRRPSPAPTRKGQPLVDPPGTFDLLGFSHYWARSRKGRWVVKRKTAPSRFTRAVTKIAQWCQIHRHHPIAEQHLTLSQKLRGHFAYYGITGNSNGLARFRQAVQRVWWEWLGRRRGGNRPSWAKFLQFEQRWPLPPPITLHSVCRVQSKGVT